ncbi:MAG: S9 family peptidase [Chitinophagaceae bacterium]|nr:S9 family peptidase [Chitinophagaceae bacterium]
MKKLFVAVFSNFLVIILFAQSPSPVTVTDMLKIKNISSVQLSPDGKQVVFSVLSIEPEDSKWEYKYATQLWITTADGSSAPRPLTTSKEGASQPTWSPDGKQIAFVRAAEGKPQIFLLSLEGGEPKQLTKSKYGASSPRWNADGSALLFMGSISLKDLMTDSLLNPGKQVPSWSLEKPGFLHNENLQPSAAKANPDGTIEEVRAYLENNEKDKKAKVLNKLNFQEESTTSGELNFSHVFLLQLKDPGNPKPITKGFYSFSNPQFIKGTNKILLEGDVNETTHPDRTLETQLYTVNNDGSGLKKLLGKNDYNYSGSSISPSGKWIALQQGATGFVAIPTLSLLPIDGSEKDLIPIPFDRNIGNIIWSEDEKTLWFSAQSNGGVTLNKVDIGSRKVTTLTDFNSGIGSYSIKGDKLVFVKTAVENPFELYSANSNAANPIRISSFNYDWVQQKKLSYPEKFSFKNEKGLTVEYWVMKPTNYEPGKKYPVVLEIHGGPTAMWGPGENSMWHEFQFWCSKGYGVVYANPRGSGGYGQEFLKANVKDWGNGPMQDVLTALTKATAASPWADTSKMVVTGGSYAGYLIAYIISHDNRFKAACSQRGVYDLRTFFGEGNAWRLVPNYFGGYPWEKTVLPILERESPITYVQNITTPYIMFHGENDLRTGVIQGEEMFKSLKVLGRPVEYVRHPGATHEITRSGNNRQRIDQMLRTWEFFERYIK